jgi:outer membrane protein assembly factor BamB
MRTLSLLATGGLALAAPGFLSAQQSSMFRGGPAHAGIYADPGLPRFTGIKWKVPTLAAIFSTPVVANGVVYVGSNDGGVYAVDAETGSIRWRFATGGRVNSSPAVANGLVYVLSYDGNVYAIDAASGRERWKFATGGEHRFTASHLHGALPEGEQMPDPYDMFLSSPTIAGGTVYIGSSDGHVYALNAESGSLAWKYKTGDIVHASPAVSDGTVYIGSWDSWFYALDAGNGALRWRFKTGEDPDIHNQQGMPSSAAVVNSVVYFGCRDGHLYAVDARTGSKKWGFSTGGAWVTSSPAVYQGVVYFGTGSDFRIHALNAETGASVFMIQADRSFFSSPAIAGNLVYMGGSDGKLSAFTLPGGSPAWVFQTPESAEAHTAYLAFRETIGKDTVSVEPRYYDRMVERFTRQLTGSMMASPVIANGVIYIGSVDGNLYALE